jgi:integration host factor subunit beta|tara:strand:- start:1640 stop:2038 length:399 start_codon:yes stop_codon:yes gene_type:complete
MADTSMTKSELIERLVDAQARTQGLQLTSKDVELAVKTILEQMARALAGGDRIEIRGFGSFSLHYRAPRIGRNPKTGESVGLAGKHVPHFKPGKELRDRVNQALQQALAVREAEQTAGEGGETVQGSSDQRV